MAPRAVRIFASAVLACALGPWALPDEAGATAMLELVDVPADLSNAGFDASDGNFHEMQHVYRNVSGGNLLLDALTLVMLDPEDLGFADIVPGSNDGAVVAAGEAAHPGFLFSLRRHPDDLNAVGWVFAEATVNGADHVLTSLNAVSLIAPLALAPGQNFTVFFRVHNGILGGSSAQQIGELVLGVHFTPEPSTALLLGGGLLGLLGVRRRARAG